MPKETINLSILFADIAKSTHIYEVLGNQKAQALIAKCLDRLRKVTDKYKGTVIKTIGDEIMCTFDTPVNAVEAGKEMHKALETLDLSDIGYSTNPNIYVGIQHGPVIQENGDVFGDAVNVASRMKTFSKQRQIITTEDTINLLPIEYRSCIRLVDKTTIKGKSGEANIYEIIWEEEDVTTVFTRPLETLTNKIKLEIRCGDKSLTVNHERPSITLGRQPHNDVVVNNNKVSRTHARIEYRKGKFILSDQSTNGTYLNIQRSKEVNIKRDEATLIGSGMIGLGQAPVDGAPETIYFAINL